MTHMASSLFGQDVGMAYQTIILPFSSQSFKTVVSDRTGFVIIGPDRSTLVEHNSSDGHGIHNIAAGKPFQLLMDKFNATVATVKKGQIVARVVPETATIRLADPRVTDFLDVTPMRNMEDHSGLPRLPQSSDDETFLIEEGGGELSEATDDARRPLNRYRKRVSGFVTGHSNTTPLPSECLVRCPHRSLRSEVADGNI